MKEPYLDQVILKRILRYSRRTGVFTWKRRDDVGEWWNGRYAGKAAGYEWSPDGKRVYRCVRIFDYPFLAHRLAWLFVKGEWPIGVDHRDGSGTNNKWKNLREATDVQNGANRGRNSNNTTGFKGVSRVGSRFRATIQYNRIWRQIGVFDRAEDAHSAYASEARRLAGKFARTS